MRIGLFTWGFLGAEVSAVRPQVPVHDAVVFRRRHGEVPVVVRCTEGEPELLLPRVGEFVTACAGVMYQCGCVGDDRRTPPAAVLFRERFPQLHEMFPDATIAVGRRDCDLHEDEDLRRPQIERVSTPACSDEVLFFPGAIHHVQTAWGLTLDGETWDAVLPDIFQVPLDQLPSFPTVLIRDDAPIGDACHEQHGTGGAA